MKKNKIKVSRDVKMLVKNIEKAEKNRDLGKKINCLVEKAEKIEIWIKYELYIPLSF